MEEVILKERETREKIAEVLNNSKIPAMCLKTILKDFLEVTEVLEQQQYQQAKKVIEQQEKSKEAKNKNEKRGSSHS